MDLRKEMGIVSQGRAHNPNGVLIHLAFRMSQMDAERFIRAAAEVGMSESLWARLLIIDWFSNIHAMEGRER